MPALIARHLHRLPPTSTRLSRRVERFCLNVLRAVGGGIVLSAACFAIGVLRLVSGG